MLKKIEKVFKNSDLDIYKLIWLFLIASFFGFLLENIWYVIKWGKFVYNQGLVWGPFQQIYGFGAVILTILSVFLKKKKPITIFIFGFIAFGLFEYLGGIYQEFFTGTFSWDYSRVGYNFVIAKYIYLPYCAVWGIFSVLWSKFNQKILNRLNIFSKKPMRIITIIIGVFFVINLLLTSIAMSRLVERNNNMLPKNIVEKIIDKHFDDEYMQKWLPKVRVINKVK